MADAQLDDSLEPVPEDWTTALAVVAHPDDMEYGASAAVARWTDQGKVVDYLLVTAGEAGMDFMAPEDAGPVRREEQQAACDVVGVRHLEVLDFPDGMLTEGLDLRRAIAATIRRVRPEMVVTINHRETFGPGRLNMADHMVVGRAVIDAVRDAGNRWVFRDLLDEGLEPWPGVRWVAVANSPESTHAVDVAATLDRGVASLAAHRAYLDALGPGPMSDPEGFLRMLTDQVAPRFGGRPAVGFELFAM